MELFEQIRREYEFGEGIVIGVAHKPATSTVMSGSNKCSISNIILMCWNVNRAPSSGPSHWPHGGRGDYSQRVTIACSHS